MLWERWSITVASFQRPSFTCSSTARVLSAKTTAARRIQRTICASSSVIFTTTFWAGRGFGLLMLVDLCRPLPKQVPLKPGGEGIVLSFHQLEATSAGDQPELVGQGAVAELPAGSDVRVDLLRPQH